MASGWIVNALLKHDDWDPVRAYRAIFLLYAALGLVKLLLALMLSRKCEIEKTKPEEQSGETAPLLAGSGSPPKSKKRRSILPAIAKDSVPTVVKLCLLFGLDAFASGLVSL